METTKQQQINGLIFGAISLLLPNVSSIISRATSDTKAATEAGEKKILGTVGLIVSIVGTVYAALIFIILGVCVACVVCVGAAALASA